MPCCSCYKYNSKNLGKQSTCSIASRLATHFSGEYVFSILYPVVLVSLKENAKKLSIKDNTVIDNTFIEITSK